MEQVRDDGNRCFACSPHNPVGLQIRFEMRGDVCIGWYTPAADHVGYDDLVHGGLLFTALDDVMANWLYLQGRRGHTARASLRYRKPASVGRLLRLEGRATEERSRLVKLASAAIEDETGEIIVESEATFMLA